MAELSKTIARLPYVNEPNINDLILIEHNPDTLTETSHTTISDINKAVRKNISQNTPATTWNIKHNLGYNPNVTIVNSLGQVIIGNVIYNVNEMELLVKFNSPKAGAVFLS